MKRILVIEDNMELRENTVEILQLEGYEVLMADNGTTGAEIAFAEKPDLIFCDIMMPGMDGYTVLYLLGKNRNTMNIPFIFLTARTEKSDVQKGLGLGATNYLIKPFTDAELLSAVEFGLKKTTMVKFAPSCTGQQLEDFIKQAKFSFDIPLSAEGLVARKLSAREALFSENDEPDAVYFVIKGKIKSYLMNEQGNEIVTNMHGPGEFLGYNAILESTDHKDNAVAVEDAELLLLSKNDFLLLAYQERALSSQLVKFFAGNDINKEEKLVSLVYYSFRKKVVDSLLSIFEKIKEGITKEQITGSLHVKTEYRETPDGYLSKILNDLKSDKLIDIEKERIIIKEEKQLKRLLEVEKAYKL